jgi:hypothetical protein
MEVLAPSKTISRMDSRQSFSNRVIEDVGGSVFYGVVLPQHSIMEALLP